MTNINPTDLKNFIIANIGTSLSKSEAADFDAEKDFADLSEELDVDEIDIEDFSDDILEKFAIAYKTETEDKKAEAKDKEKEKEEQTAVKQKNGTGV